MEKWKRKVKKKRLEKMMNEVQEGGKVKNAKRKDKRIMREKDRRDRKWNAGMINA